MVESLLLRFGLLAVFGGLFGAGLGLPIPEEATQLAAGVLAHEGDFGLLPALATCWAGILAGDVAWFLLARRHGERVLASRPVARVLTPARREKLEDHLSRHAFLSVMVARHTSGLRLAAFALAATHRVRLTTFALADGLSALVSVPLVVGAAYLFSHHIHAIKADVRRVELGILAAVLVGLAAAWLWRRSRRGARAPA